VALLVFAFRSEEEIEIPPQQIALFEQRHQTEAAAL